ncbi:hypothetical protein K4F52_004356 [Lecanicillium sp. MT-2017a]|nr:hypothetical protein K4F52_004356 [Lecanicillium sp. MT-2017a]
MQFSQLTVLFFAAVVSAGVVPRDLQTFRNVMAAVQTKTDALDAAVNAYNGNVQPVSDAADDLVDTVDSGNTQLVGQPQLSLSDTLVLNQDVTAFKSHARTLVDDLKAKRPQVITDGHCGLVRDKITEINSSSDTLINTLVSKVDPAAKAIAEGQAKDIRAILQDAKDSYSTANCP